MFSMGSQTSRNLLITIICLTPRMNALRTLEVQVITGQSEGRNIRTIQRLFSLLYA
jgi:hypothetical protein